MAQSPAGLLPSGNVTEAVRVVRAPPGLIWRALTADQVVGTVRTSLRPNGRWFLAFEACRADSYQPLLAAVADNTASDLYATIDEADQEALETFARLGFEVTRREGNYLIPSDPAVTGLDGSTEPDGTVIISAADAYEDQLRLLDDALRQDVPGAAGWQWDPGDFREETYDSPDFDPATYLIAVDSETGDYIGLARVWNNPGQPRLGLIAVKRDYRRRGLARALLGRAFAVLHQRGKAQVTAEIDDTNTASLALLLGLGARRDGSSVELIKRYALPPGSLPTQGQPR